jgi:hypothetical protein
MKRQQTYSLFVSLLPISLFSAVTLNFLANPTVVHAQDLKLPSIATVTEIVQGDLACYVDLVDDNGKEYEGVYAIFEICEQQDTFFNKRVKLTYQEERFNDCQSEEPCGKTQLVTAITEMQLVR